MRFLNTDIYPVPCLRRTLHLPISPTTLETRLRDVVIPREHSWESSVAVKGNFEGRVTAQDFAVTRVLGYRNSFVPTLRGKFAAASQGTRLTLTLVMHPFTIIFLLAWCSVVAGVTILSLASCIRSRHWEPAALIPLLMLTGCYLTVIVGYSIEANKALRFLHDVANGATQITDS